LDTFLINMQGDTKTLVEAFMGSTRSSPRPY
jgi:hypothetical protein